MKKYAYACGAAIAVAAIFMVLGSAHAADQKKSETITVKGEVVDLWCYIDHEGHGEKHKGCAIACVKAGNPIGLAAEDGKLYILMGSEKHQPGSAVALDKMADTVTVTGELIKKGGLKAIYIKEIK